MVKADKQTAEMVKMKQQENKNEGEAVQEFMDAFQMPWPAVSRQLKRAT